MKILLQGVEFNCPTNLFVFFFFSAVLSEDIILGQDEGPLLLTQFVLQIPTIAVVPTIDELQFYFGQVVSNLISIHKELTIWGQKFSLLSKKRDTLGVETIDGDELRMLRTYEKIVSEHKEIIRTSMSLQGTILILRNDIAMLGNVIIVFFSLLVDKIHFLSLI